MMQYNVAHAITYRKLYKKRRTGLYEINLRGSNTKIMKTGLSSINYSNKVTSHRGPFMMHDSLGFLVSVNR